VNHAAHDSNGTHAHEAGVEPVARHADMQADPVCPYCGGAVAAAAGRIGDVGTRCPSCKGLLDELSIHATRGHMGDWFIRDEGSPFRPGCSLATLRTMIERGRVVPTSVVRGPDTDQFWHLAGRVPRIAKLMGICHECGVHVAPDAIECMSCGTHLMTMHDALVEPSWHGGGAAHGHAPAHAANPLAAAVAAPQRTIAAELADTTVKRQMQREVQTWARRAGLSIGIAVILFLVVIALATKDMWWSRVRGGSEPVLVVEPPGPAVTTRSTPPATPTSATPTLEVSQAATGEQVPGEQVPGEQAPAAAEPAKPQEKAPPPPERAGRDPLWDQVMPLIAKDTNESLMEAMNLLQRIIDTVGVTRADEHARAIGTRDWIERRLQTRELEAMP